MKRKPSARELPLVKRRITALLEKAEANGLHTSEAATAIAKARELVKQYKLDPSAFRWPQEPPTVEATPTSEPAPSSRGRGVGKLAERLIVEHPDWTYRRIAEEVNVRVEGAAASEKSVRWYASKMRQRGEDAPDRRRKK